MVSASWQKVRKGIAGLSKIHIGRFPIRSVHIISFDILYRLDR